MSPRRRLTVVRHAHALDRSAWAALELDRPLSPRGRDQAEGLVEPLLAGAPRRALTSPARRCVDTLAPFAARAGLALEVEPLLTEGGPPEAALDRLLDELAGLAALTPPAGAPLEPAPALVACTHGDVLQGIVALLARRGVELDTGPFTPSLLETPKAGRWELETDGSAILAGRLVGPPPAPGRTACGEASSDARGNPAG